MKTRALFHIHSTWSYDGNFELEKIISRAGRAGFKAVFTFEHDRGYSQEKLDHYLDHCRSLSDESCIIVPGIEYSSADNAVHICVCGTERFYGEGLAPGELMDHVQRDGALAIMAHPARKDAWKLVPGEFMSSMTGVEIWNRKVDGFTFSREGLDMMRQYSLAPFVSLDFHRRRQIFPLWMKLDAGKPLSEDALLAAVRENRIRPRFLGISAAVFYGSPLLWFLNMLEAMRKKALSLNKRTGQN